MLTEINSAIASVKVALEFVKAANGLANQNAIVDAVNEVNSKLLGITTAALEGKEKEGALQHKVAELEKKLGELDNFEAEAKRYSLTEVSSQVFAQVLKADSQNGEPIHWLCNKCFLDKKKSVLNLFHEVYAGKTYVCDNCGSKLFIPTHHPGTPPPAPSSRGNCRI